MNIKYWLGCAVTALAMSACSDTTNEIGQSIINNFDKLNVTTESFNVQTQSLKLDSVLSQSPFNYLGIVQDPETNTIVSNSYSTQFHTLDNFSIPVSLDSIPHGADGNLVADSCELSILYDGYYGDSTAVMQVSAYELSAPMLENRRYYSNFNPETQGYVATNAYQSSAVYTLVNPSETATERSDRGSIRYINIPLNAPYTAKNNVTYTNYGSYLLNAYRANPANFRNTFSFITNVVPGFYFKNTSGQGAMANVFTTRLIVYYSYRQNNQTRRGTALFSGTEEVLSATHVVNSQTALNNLLNDNTATYLKSPAGIATEVTLPVEAIISGHERDSLNTARIAFTSFNTNSSATTTFRAPQTILMLPKSELQSFFENNRLIDNRTSFLATFDASLNQYVFSNISSLVKHLYDERQAGNTSQDWNKVVLVPVTTSYATDAGTNARTLTGIYNDMSLTNAKLVGGPQNSNEPVKITVIYSRFQ